jgi:hypothetical protein
MMSAKLDDRRRLVMPPECPPNSAVTIDQLDEGTWLVKVTRESKKFKWFIIPVIDDLPADKEWEKVEKAFAKAACRNLPD